MSSISGKENMTKREASKRLSLDNVKTEVGKGESKSRVDAPEAEDLPEAFWNDAVRVTRRPAIS